MTSLGQAREYVHTWRLSSEDGALFVEFLGFLPLSYTAFVSSMFKNQNKILLQLAHPSWPESLPGNLAAFPAYLVIFFLPPGSD